MEDAGVVALVARQLVAGVPLVRNAGEQGANLGFERGEVAVPQDIIERPPAARFGGPVIRQERQQTGMQAQPHLQIRIAQAVEAPAGPELRVDDGQVSGLEHQRFGPDSADVERGEERAGGHPVHDLVAGQVLPREKVQQERRGARLEPVGAELPAVEHQQHIVRVVDGLAQPAVAVVPLADRFAVEPPQLGREDPVQFVIGVSADGCAAGVERDVLQVVQPGEEVDLRELAHAGQHQEADVRVAGLERPVETAEEVAVGAGDLGLAQVVEDRLVGLVHEHHDAPTVLVPQSLDQVRQTVRRRVAVEGDARPACRGREALDHGSPQPLRRGEVAVGEVELQDRMANGPVPPVVDRQVAEQLLASLEELLQGAHQQTLPEAPGPRQEIRRAARDEPLNVRCLVDIVVSALPHLAEGLDADRQPPTRRSWLE